MRMEMLGLKMFNPVHGESFGIRMVDVNDPTNELLSSIG